jgi:hypothetical protein
MADETKSTRTAAEVLLSLEAKIDRLIGQVNLTDLNLKNLSNKLNHLIDGLSQLPMEENSVGNSPYDIASAPPAPMEQMPQMTVETAPVGFQRHSRSETFASTPAFNDRPQKTVAGMPAFSERLPRDVPTPSIPQPEMFPAQEPSNTVIHESSGTKKQLMQRILDKNGKAIFMAEVEILDERNITVCKGLRTDGVGKWRASLLPGKYKVVLRKRDVQGKNNIEITQDLTVDTKTPNELQTMIVK